MTFTPQPDPESEPENPAAGATSRSPSGARVLASTSEGIDVAEWPGGSGRGTGHDVVAPQFCPDPVWAWLREQILTRPQWVAQRVGIEQIGYLTELRRPKPLPSLAELEEVWRCHFNKSAEQKRKVLACWRDFKQVLGVAGVRDITPEAAVAFRDAVYGRGMSGKSQQNIFTRIRRMVSFARDRAIAVEELSRVLQVLSLLKPSENTVTLNPIPIDVDDWKALHGAAAGDEKAMVLLMLNCAMYVAEAIRLKWDDVKGDCLVTRRLKTGKCIRVATLWPETIEALGAVRRRGEYIFYAYHGRPLGIKGADRRWRQLRQAAGRPGLLSSQLRDGAYSSAVEANIEPHVCQLLLGHRSGIGDHYVLRKPGMVRPACEAVRRHYFG